MKKCVSCPGTTVKHDRCYNCRRKDKFDRGEYKRNRNLLTRYGITTEEFNQLLESQDDACAICEKKEVSRFVVDHCHDKGHIRGILCCNCNKALGKFGDTIEGVTKVLRYLEKAK